LTKYLDIDIDIDNK